VAVPLPLKFICLGSWQVTASFGVYKYPLIFILGSWQATATDVP